MDTTLQDLNALCDTAFVEWSKESIVQFLKIIPMLPHDDQKAAKKIWRHVYKKYDVLQNTGFSTMAYCIAHKKPMSIVPYLIWSGEKEYPCYLESWDITLKERSPVMTFLVECFKTHNLEAWMDNSRSDLGHSLANDYWYVICAMLERHRAFETYQHILMKYHTKISWDVGHHFMEDMPIHWLANLKEIPAKWEDKGLQCVDMLILVDDHTYCPLRHMKTVCANEETLYL